MSIPIKRLAQNSLALGSNPENQVIFTDLNMDELRYIYDIATAESPRKGIAERLNSERKTIIDAKISEIMPNLDNTKDCRIGISELGDLGLRIAISLVEAGFKYLLVPSDSDVEGLKSMLTARNLSAFVTKRASTPIDFMVVINHHSYQRKTCDQLFRKNIPYLVVLIRDTDAIVGPLCQPGVSACIDCAALNFGEITDNDIYFDTRIDQTNPTDILANNLIAAISVNVIHDYISSNEIPSSLISIRPKTSITYADNIETGICGCNELFSDLQL